MKGCPVWRPARCYTASSCLAAPATMAGGTRRRARSAGAMCRGTRQQESRRPGRPGQKCPWSASQLQPGPWAAGIQRCILERLPSPSARLTTPMLQPHTAGQSLSQDISLFPGNARTSLFLPVLKRSVLASVCSWKCQVQSLWHRKSLILKRPSFKVCLPC